MTTRLVVQSLANPGPLVTPGKPETLGNQEKFVKLGSRSPTREDETPGKPETPEWTRELRHGLNLLELTPEWTQGQIPEWIPELTQEPTPGLCPESIHGRIHVEHLEIRVQTQQETVDLIHGK
jgi:hypothetical protein